MPKRAKSRCTIPRNIPLSTKWVVADSVNVLSEVQSYTQAGTATENAIRRAEIFFRLKQAESGILKPPRQINVVNGHPEVWEIRWDTDSRHLRLYHGEPPKYPDHLVPLRFHIKRTDGTSKQIAKRQTKEMRVAITRYKKWEQKDWFI